MYFHMDYINDHIQYPEKLDFNLMRKAHLILEYWNTVRLLFNKMINKRKKALVTGDYWQVDGLHRELIRHHKDKRQYSYLHETQRSETTPFPKDQLLDERETHIEYQKSKKKVLYKDNWRTEKKRFSDKMEEFWEGKTVYKIKKDYVIPDDVVRSDTDRQAKLFRGNIDDLFHPESASSSKPVSVQKKPNSQQREAGRKLLRGPGLKQIEVGPPAEKLRRQAETCGSR